MAGGVTKGFGVVALVFGLLLVLGGLAAAGFGAYTMNEEGGALIRDERQVETAEALLVAGAVAGGAGLLFLGLGGILLAIGGSMARRELLHALARPASVPAEPVAAPAPTKRRTFALVLVVAGIVVGGLFGALAMAGGDDDPPRLGAWGGTPRSEAAPIERSFDGHVRGAGFPVVGSVNSAPAIHELSLSGTYDLTGVLNWTVGAGGASSLLLILESESNGEWSELARGEGGPGLTVSAMDVRAQSNVRARIFVGGAGAADQDYTLVLVARE